MELAPRQTPGQSAPLPNLDANTLNSALSVVAAYIAKKKQNIVIIAVGGAVNTIYLRSRASTHDVDFFNNNLTPADLALLMGGAQETCKTIKAPQLQEGWFNNHTIFFIAKDQRETLTRDAYAQNEVVFRQPGLTVLAAPWYYAFCCKVDRRAGSGVTASQPYDLSDAVAYIKRHMAVYKLTRVKISEIKEWFARFQLRWNANVEAVLAEVTAAGVAIVP